MSEAGSGDALGVCRVSTLLSLCVIGALAACTTRESRDDAPAVPEQPPLRADHDRPIGPDPAVFAEEHTGEIRRNDSLSAALARFEVGAAELEELVSSLKGVFDVRTLRPGRPFELKKDEQGRIAWFRYFASPTTVVLAFRGSEGALHALLEPIKVVTTTTLVEGTIQSSLYEAMESAGEQAVLALGFVDLFAWDVDFFTETQVGDAFRIWIEKRYVEGKLVGYGKIIGAEYAMASGRSHRAFLFTHARGEHGYYTEDGTSVRKAFLKSPIQFASITSRYGLRKHPILNYVGTHHGIDYGAPAGTSVWAVGDGVVRHAGPAGGYGNMVAIQHRNGLETRYAHLRAFGAGIRKGRHVSQKQIVGHVGMTGLATGPHLHFEVLKAGRWMNPLSVAVPPAPPIAAGEKDAFAESIAPAVHQIAEAGRRSLARASADRAGATAGAGE